MDIKLKAVNSANINESRRDMMQIKKWIEKLR